MKVICKVCNSPTHELINGRCPSCDERIKRELLASKVKDAKNPADLKCLNSKELVDLFYLNLGKYVKTKDSNCLQMVRLAYYWACHADRAVATAMSYALEWSKVSLYEVG